MTTTDTSSVNARSLFSPYLFCLLAAMALIQVIIAATGGQITLLAPILTAVVALGITGWLWWNRSRLLHIRFGFVIAHTIAFITVTASYNLHALIRIFFQDSGQAAAKLLVGTSWFGATLVMTALWGLGFLIHLTGSVLGRGWED